MKRIFIAAAIFLAAGSVKLYAQDDEIKEFQKEWGQDKKELVRMAMSLTPADSIKFWPLYDKYEMARQKIGRDRIMIIKDYADHYMDMSDGKADQLVNRIFKNDAELVKLQQQYYKSVKGSMGAKQAAKFLQVETYIISIIKSAIQEEIPVIGELDHMKKTL
jgi:hypothetical protein